MKVVDLFSGIGGFHIGLEAAGMEIIAHCEINPFCQKILKKHWPDVPIFDDIFKLKREDISGPVDLVCGGFPCQPFSVAGKQKGKEDDRFLWPEMLRVIKEFKPNWVLAENVTGIINMALDEVLSDLEGEGYETTTFIIPACAKDAPHRRDRVWIVAYSEFITSNQRHKSSMQRRRQDKTEQIRMGSCAQDVVDSGLLGQAQHEIKTTGLEQCGKKGNVPDSDSKGLQGPAQGEFRSISSQAKSFKRSQSGGTNAKEWTDWPTEPNVGRVANGIPSRVDRLKGLGNAVVPQIVEVIGRAILNQKTD